MSEAIPDTREWLEADGLGGFASGTAGLIRTRRYHALLLTAMTPPTGRVVLVNGFEAWLETADGRVALSSQRYQPDVVHPDGATRLESFTLEPWPTWTFRVGDAVVRQEIFVAPGTSRVFISFQRDGAGASLGSARVVLRPLLSGRDYHALHHENAAVSRDFQQQDELVSWQPYAGLPRVVSRSNGTYRHSPDWYRRFRYSAETERGLDDTEDLYSPGELSWDLSEGAALLVLGTDEAVKQTPERTLQLVTRVRLEERARRAAFTTPLDRSADAYLVRRGSGRTIVAGYPWFTDWGRDTFIALRGLCLETGRSDDALGILREWSGAVSEGMLPNRFPDGGETPEYNSVDASLWFVIAVRDLLDSAEHGTARVSRKDRLRLLDAVTRILEGYAQGTRFGIRADDDGLLACGVPGVQLTWMDARVGNWVVTPRIGKPVEVQALWLAAIAFGARVDARWQMPSMRGQLSFAQRFWNNERQCLYDVVDVDHERGRVDASIRPNQILAVGGLGLTLIDQLRAHQIVDTVEAALLTPFGLRSLAPDDPAYAATYEGGPSERDGRYHQGTVWPWLMGPFVEAWISVRGRTPEAIREARTRFVAPLRAHLDDAGMGHVSEITDATAPFIPRGCPFQAWSLGELIRIERWLSQGSEARTGAVTTAGKAPAAFESV